MNPELRALCTLTDLPGWLRDGRLELAGLSLPDQVGNDDRRGADRRIAGNDITAVLAEAVEAA